MEQLKLMVNNANHSKVLMMFFILIMANLGTAAQDIKPKTITLTSLSLPIRPLSAKIVYVAKEDRFKPLCFRAGIFLEFPYWDVWHTDSQPLLPQTNLSSIESTITIPKPGFCKFNTKYIEVEGEVLIPGKGSIIVKAELYTPYKGDSDDNGSFYVDSERIYCQVNIDHEVECLLNIDNVNYNDTIDYSYSSRRFHITYNTSRFNEFVKKGQIFKFQIQSSNK